MLTFTAQTVSSPNRAILASDLSAVLSQAAAPLTVVTSLTPVLSGTNYALNASVVFPADNTVSATPSQATLAAVTLANALTANAAQALPGLAAKDGPITVTGISLQDALVPAGPSSSTHAPPPPPQTTLPSSLKSSPSPTGKLNQADLRTKRDLMHRVLLSLWLFLLRCACVGGDQVVSKLYV